MPHEYKRGRLPEMLSRPVTRLATFEPPNFMGDLKFEALKAAFNAALIQLEIDRLSPERSHHRLDLSSAVDAETRIIETCLHLIELRETHAFN
jgi:hypothetical protein